MDRKRINLNVDSETYERLKVQSRLHGFGSPGRMAAAAVRLVSSSIAAADNRRSEEEERQWISREFAALAESRKCIRKDRVDS